MSPERRGLVLSRTNGILILIMILESDFVNPPGGIILASEDCSKSNQDEPWVRSAEVTCVGSKMSGFWRVCSCLMAISYRDQLIPYDRN